MLFEIATIGPGFATDEDIEHLGERLALPPAYEHLREQVEKVVTPLPRSARRRGGQVSSGTLEYLVRPAAGQADGALVLFHGRGADEHDLYPLLDMLDPERRLVGVTPRGPLSLPPGGAHWYVVRQVGYPDPATFRADVRSRIALARRAGRRDGDPARAHGARRLLAGRGHGAMRSGSERAGRGPRGSSRSRGFVPDRRGLRARPRAAASRPSRSGTARSTR